MTGKPLLLPLLCLTGSLVAAGSVARAAPPATEQAYFEATVSKDDTIVSGLHALVTVGGHAKLSFRPGGAGAPRLGLTFQVERQAGAALTAIVEASVDGREVATDTVSFTRDHGTASTLAGGGYSWHVTVEVPTTDQLQRRSGKEP
jgi:hypothetical protein